MRFITRLSFPRLTQTSKSSLGLDYLSAACFSSWPVWMFFPRDRFQGTPGQVAGIPGLNSQTAPQTGAGLGTLRLYLVDCNR